MPLINDAPVTGTITTSASQAAIPVNGLGNVGLFMALTGVTGGVFNFEASIDSTDGVNGNWFPVLGMRTNASALENASGALSATPPYGWQFDVTCFNYFRVRSSAGTFGSAALWLTPGANPKVSTLFVSGKAGAATHVQGSLGVGVAFSGSNPVVVGGRTSRVNGTVRSDTHVGALAIDGQGKLIVKPFSPNDLDWQVFAAAATPITTATTTSLKGAVATFRQYVTAIQLVNNSTTGTELALQDTTATPAVMWRSFIGANGVLNVEFPTPLRTGSGTASGVSLVTVTSGCSIWWSAQGFVAY